MIEVKLYKLKKLLKLHNIVLLQKILFLEFSHQSRHFAALIHKITPVQKEQNLGEV